MSGLKCITPNCILGKEVILGEFILLDAAELGNACQIAERVSLRHCSLGAKVIVGAGTCIEQASIGNGAYIGKNCIIGGVAVRFSANGTIYRQVSPFNDGAIHDFFYTETKIGERALVGDGAIILPGVSIGAGAVIDPGSVVRRSVPAHHRCSGNLAGFAPQRIIDLCSTAGEKEA